MAWVKLDDGFFRNPKIVAISPESKLIYLAGLCYAGAALTDGFIPKNAVRMIAADADVPSPQKRAKELVDAGLWVENPRGYNIHDYLEHNTSASDVLSKREAARKRMEAKRTRSSREVRANTNGTSQEVREPETEAETEVNERDKSLSQDEREEAFLRDVSKPSRAEILEGRFDRFWEHYPRKEAKGAARKAWMKHAPSEALTERMIAAVERQKLSTKWQEDQGRFIPHPATWLNSERWEDEGTEAPAPVKRLVV